MTKQQQQILIMLQNDSGVTRLHATHMGIQNPTARIAELRRLGYSIKALSREDLQGRPYTRWVLVERPLDQRFAMAA